MSYIIALFIPVNLTEICQPLDRYLYACLKIMLYYNQLQNEQSVERVVSSLVHLNKGSRQSESGEVTTTVSTFKPSSLLNFSKELSYSNSECTHISSNSRQKLLGSDSCWKKGLFETFYDYDYQKSSVQLELLITLTMMVDIYLRKSLVLLFQKKGNFYFRLQIFFR